MTQEQNNIHSHSCSCCTSEKCNTINRREFIAGMSLAAGGLAMASMKTLANSGGDSEYNPTPPLPLKVQPVLTCQLYQRKKQRSWRKWGGLHTKQDIADEKQRIARELKKISSEAGFVNSLNSRINNSSLGSFSKLIKPYHSLSPSSLICKAILN